MNATHQELDLHGLAEYESDKPRARNTDPETSHMAAADMDAFKITATMETILAGIGNDQRTSDELIRLTGLTGSNCRSRISEMVHAGILRELPRAGLSNCGRACCKYERR